MQLRNYNSALLSQFALSFGPSSSSPHKDLQTQPAKIRLYMIPWSFMMMLSAVAESIGPSELAAMPGETVEATSMATDATDVTASAALPAECLSRNQTFRFSVHIGPLHNG
jgi:hypothetical protein